MPKEYEDMTDDEIHNLYLSADHPDDIRYRRVTDFEKLRKESEERERIRKRERAQYEYEKNWYRNFIDERNRQSWLHVWKVQHMKLAPAPAGSGRALRKKPTPPAAS